MSYWIKVRQSVVSHRKTFLLCDLLEIPRAQAVGHLTCLWCWALDNAEKDGTLKGITPGVIAISAHFDGDPQMFSDALVKSGFLEENKGVYKLHNWSTHAGPLLRKRAADNKRMSSGLQNGNRAGSERVPSVEKRREEKNREENSTPPIVPPKGKRSSLPANTPRHPDEDMLDYWDVPEEERSLGV